MLLALSLCCYRHLKADTSIIYVRQLTLRVMFSIRRWPVYWGWSLPQFRNSLDSGKGKIIDGSRICNELGFEYQYPDPLVMPLE